MKDNRDRLTRRQLLTMSFVALLSPVIRQVPGSEVTTAGRAAWLCAPAAFPPLVGLALLLAALLKNRREDEGLGEIYCRALGRPVGRALVFLYTAWFLFYTGFVLRAGADRFVAAVYPDSNPFFFVVLMTALAMVATLGRLKILARCAEVTRPLLLGVFILVFALALPGVDKSSLLPLTGADALAGIASGASAVSTLGVVAFAAFLEGRTEKGPVLRPVLRQLLPMLVIMALLCITTVGTFGAELTERMNYPFFVMIRNIRLLRLLERIEALVVAQWVITDFILVSFLLQISSGTLCLSLSGRSEPRTKLACAVCAALALASAFLCAPTAFALRYLTITVFPLGTAVLVLAVPPVVLLIGKLRHTI